MDIITETLEKSIIIDYRGKIIKLHIFGLSNGQVKFGIEAPQGVSVNREEIHEIFLAQKKARALCVV